ncbi:MAG: sugar transferase [Jatrophihabitantaceae bacterium]
MNARRSARPASATAQAFDRVLAAIGLLASSPLSALAAVAIKLSSEGPILYRASRVGQGGRLFTMFKFRTMHVERAGQAAVITGADDPRVFPAGRVLRRFKIDELPQLVNVVRGDMALVGPRPEEPSIVREHYEPWMHETLCVAPGIASPGSLAYYADEAALPQDAGEAQRRYLSEVLAGKLALELVYVRNRSWRYDVELVLRALAAILGRRDVFPARQAWERAEAKRLADTWHCYPKPGAEGDVESNAAARPRGEAGG